MEFEHDYAIDLVGKDGAAAMLEELAHHEANERANRLAKVDR